MACRGQTAPPCDEREEWFQWLLERVARRVKRKRKTRRENIKTTVKVQRENYSNLGPDER